MKPPLWGIWGKAVVWLAVTSVLSPASPQRNRLQPGDCRLTTACRGVTIPGRMAGTPPRPQRRRFMNDSPTASQLLEQALQGDREALGLLLEAQRSALHRLAEGQLQGRIASRVDASDAIQQTF